MEERLFDIKEIVRNLPAKATKTVLYENERTNTVVWYVPPGEEVPAHYHPETDDTWIVLEGEGDYFLEKDVTRTISKGMVATAPKGAIHGVKAKGSTPLIFVAVSAPMPVEMIKV